MLMEEISAIGLPPPISLIRPGTIGRNIGITTPDELEYAEIMPVIKPSQALTVTGLETAPMILTNAFKPPDLSITSISTVTPHTIIITNQGITLTAFLLSPAPASIRTQDRINATDPTLDSIFKNALGNNVFMPGKPGTTTRTIKRAIMLNVSI